MQIKSNAGVNNDKYENINRLFMFKKSIPDNIKTLKVKIKYTLAIMLMTLRKAPIAQKDT